jgi:flagellin
LKINSKSHSLGVQRELKDSQNELADSSLNLASGKRVNKASDDSAALSQGAKANATLRSKDQATRNANQMVGVLQVAEGAINTMVDMVVRIRELAIQSASNGIGTGERTVLGFEVKELMSEIDRLAKNTSYQGVQIFSGEDRTLDFQVDSGSGKKNKISINMKDMAQSTYALGINDISIDTQRHATHSLYKLDYALTALEESRAKLGSNQKRVEAVIGKLGEDRHSLARYKSKIEDADIAYETSRNMKATMQQKTQTFVASYVNMDPNATLKLLK